MLRVVGCGNCKWKYPNGEAIALFFKHKYKNCHESLFQSLKDGFNVFPLKQMKSLGYSNSTQRICQLLDKSGIPCPKCNRVHWQ